MYMEMSAEVQDEEKHPALMTFSEAVMVYLDLQNDVVVVGQVLI